MKFKRLLAVVLACIMCISVLVIPASANVTNIPSNMSHFINDVYEDFQAYRNGNISLTDFLDLYAKNCLKWGYNNVSDASHIKDVLLGLQNLGVDVPDAWLKYYYEYNDIEKDDSELAGYGAILKSYGVYNGKKYVSAIYYGQKGELYNYHSNKDGGVQYVQFTLPYEKAIYYDRNSDEIRTDNNANIISSTYYYDNPSWAMLGNWVPRNGTGTTDGIVSDLPDKPAPSFDDMSDDDLIDFLDKLLEDLRLSYPDLSNLEGLLNAILAKLGTLDSDNDNELLMQILAAIQALKNNGETADNSELLNTLEELKNALVFKDGDKVSSLAELLNTLVQNQVRRSDITIDPSLYNQRYALIEAKLFGKFSFISEIKNFVQYAIDSYSNTENLPTITIDLFNYQHTIDFSAFDGSINLIRWIVAAFVYLSYAFATFRKIPGYINGGDNQ